MPLRARAIPRWSCSGATCAGRTTFGPYLWNRNARTRYKAGHWSGTRNRLSSSPIVFRYPHFRLEEPSSFFSSYPSRLLLFRASGWRTVPVVSPPGGSSGVVPPHERRSRRKTGGFLPPCPGVSCTVSPSGYLNGVWGRRSGEHSPATIHPTTPHACRRTMRREETCILDGT